MRQIRVRTPSGFVRTGTWENDRIQAGDRTYSPEDVTVLAPCTPSKIVCIGLNYHDHIDETGKDLPDRPMLFLKPPNTVAAHGDTITLSPSSHQFDHEAELGAVIGQQCRNVSSDEAMQYIRGFTCVNDLSNRDDQLREQNWVRGKAFDSAAPLGPVVASPERVPDDASIVCRVNGEERQHSSRDNLIFPVPKLIEEISRHLTLEPGDVIATGTPSGVSALEEGDVVEIDIEGVGVLRNEIRFRE